MSTNPYSFTTLPSSLLNGNGLSITGQPADAMFHVKGRAVFEKEIILSNGQDLTERLEAIEQRLDMPSRNVILEAKYERLRELANLYREELERCRTWEALQKKD